jgi:uncharacterized protein DUF6600
MTPRTLLPVVLAVVGSLGLAPAIPRADAPAPVVTRETFERSIAGGEWRTLSPYGRVWRPLQVGPGWRPYLYGEWVWTDEGWLWVTDEPWGWATYHYGRWVLDPALGWVWIPGLEWAPAWVAWRFGDGVVGWAPLWPGSADWWMDPLFGDPAIWIFVPEARFVGVPAHRAAFPPARAPTFVRRTRPAPPARPVPGRPVPARPMPAPPFGGPPRAEVGRVTPRPVPEVRIVPVPTPAEAQRAPRGGTAPAFRPARPAPVRTPGVGRPAPTAPRPGRPAPARPGPETERRR